MQKGNHASAFRRSHEISEVTSFDRVGCNNLITRIVVFLHNTENIKGLKTLQDLNIKYS